MKNRRFTIVAFLLVAVVAMSVGFATITRKLEAHGNVFLTLDDTFALKLVDPEVDASSTTSNNNTVTFEKTTNDTVLNVTVPAGVFDAADELLVIKVTVENQNAQYKAKLQTPTITYSSTGAVSSNYLEVTSAGVDESKVLAVSDGTAGSGPDTAEWTITVKLKAVPVSNVELSFSLGFEAEAQENLNS